MKQPSTQKLKITTKPFYVLTSDAFQLKFHRRHPKFMKLTNVYMSVMKLKQKGHLHET